MTTINGRPFDDLPELEQWLAVLLAKGAPGIEESCVITVNGRPCDLIYLAEGVQGRLHRALLAGRLVERRMLKRRLAQVLERLAFAAPPPPSRTHLSSEKETHATLS